MLPKVSKCIWTANYKFKINLLIHIHEINFIDIAEEHLNIQEADDLVKLANKLDPNSTSELEIECYME